MNLRTCLLTTVTAAGLLLAGCGDPGVESVQRGYRGTGMAVVYSPDRVATQYAANAAPASQEPASPDGPRASEVYQNVKVLDDLSIGEFTRVMASITEWVVPKDLPPEQGGCNYCHAGADFATDGKYTKVVARRMLEMTRDINTKWKSHVAATGVTCYTCHRGKPVPAYAWFKDPGPGHQSGWTASRAEQNTPALAAGLTSLPYDPFTPFLLDAKPIRVQGTSIGGDGNRNSIKQAEWTYSLMVHMSNSLGVNCSYCHNTRAWASWAESPPQRATAWHGIRMAREINVDYMTPLTATFPANRHGPLGDVAKVNCSTCHQGVYKPLFGVSMAKDYPELLGRRAPPAPPVDPAAEGAPADPAAAAAPAAGTP